MNPCDLRCVCLFSWSWSAASAALRTFWAPPYSCSAERLHASVGGARDVSCIATAVGVSMATVLLNVVGGGHHGGACSAGRAVPC